MKLTALLTVLLILSLFAAGCSNENNTNKDNKGGENMKNPVVVMETSNGVVEIELDAKNAPLSTENFLSYVREGYYDGLIFHRVIPNFMIQGGGFYYNGTQKATKEPIKLESRNGLKNTRGTIAMARTNDPDSATSQFFINLVDNDFLNYRPGNDGYAVFGKVVVGMNVVDNIAKVRTGNFSYYQDWPVETITIKKMYVKE